MERNNSIKALLLQDLGARLFYGVKGLAYIVGEPCNTNTNIVGIINESIVTNYESPMLDLINLNSKDITIKPYLRPMSSMTEEEKDHFCYLTSLGFVGISTNSSDNINDWLNANHFDYRGLIEKGLAIAVTEKNNPYKN